MPYIIENVNILRGRRLTTTSIFVKQNQIALVKPSFKKYRHMKMDANSFIMTPSYVILDGNIPFDSPFNNIKEYYIRSFILKGCTTLLTYFTVRYERELSDKLKQLQANLFNCPIDYVIAIRIPARALSPSLIRRCKKEKIPVIFVDISSSEKLLQLPWGWIREAMFPYNAPLIPIFQLNNDKAEATKQLWIKIMKEEGIPSMNAPLENGSPIPNDALRKIGIYPLKGTLFNGGELSYNFYLKNDRTSGVDEFELFKYYNDKLLVTVHKGTVIRAGKNVLFRPGHGEYVKITTTPSFYIVLKDIDC
ncbi:hypothetical protein K6959_09860 [Bacillus aquiflavi]|uniref:hypothetical protein n=1 Tax=Bacillus aquiflavi TaxID=2672567 RepID=UPI001CA868FE|nr:hypothetical protein [Bacillus aquiflavi]UAC47067.1 hypothetical protein K6959_09860 [Bacillus aquiflavi]